MKNPNIPMTPEQLPQQRVYEVKKLPQRPEPFPCTVEVPQEAVPKKGPHIATYLGQVEWAWSPMNNSLECYYLHRGRKYWVLWLRHFSENWCRWEWHPIACVHHKGISEKEAAVYLLMTAWKNLECDKYHWINEEGFLSIAELEAIARKVWGNDS